MTPTKDDMNFFNDYIAATIGAFESNKRLADRAVAQVSDELLHASLDPSINSVAVIMKHVAGNLISRWTDFLTTDGEKPWRNRDDEFVDGFDTRAELLAYWEQGFACLFEALRHLTPADMETTIHVRGEPHSPLLAIQRSLGHTCYHIGQIVQVARVHVGDQWQTLTIPRGGSEQYNRDHWGRG
jgi:hypothetical protein